MPRVSSMKYGRRRNVMPWGEWIRSQPTTKRCVDCGAVMTKKPHHTWNYWLSMTHCHKCVKKMGGTKRQPNDYLPCGDEYEDAKRQCRTEYFASLGVTITEDLR